MKVVRTATVKVTDLKVDLFVRKELKHDWALQLGELISAGVVMKDKIRVTEDMVILDGRHRKEAYELAGVKEIEVEIVRVSSELEFISEAYRANTGGSMPPTKEDTEHVVALLLNRGESMKRIAEILALPTSVARKYATDVKSRMRRANMQRAIESITEGGLNVSKAADQYGVDLDELKAQIYGVRKKKALTNGIGEMHRQLSFNQRSASQKTANLLRTLLNRFEDGDVTEKQVRDIIDDISRAQKRGVKVLSEWVKRFDAKTRM